MPSSATPGDTPASECPEGPCTGTRRQLRLLPWDQPCLPARGAGLPRLQSRLHWRALGERHRAWSRAGLRQQMGTGSGLPVQTPHEGVC